MQTYKLNSNHLFFNFFNTIHTPATVKLQQQNTLSAIKTKV